MLKKEGGLIKGRVLNWKNTVIVFERWPKRKPEVTKSCRIPGKSVHPLSDVSTIGVAGGSRGSEEGQSRPQKA